LGVVVVPGWDASAQVRSCIVLRKPRSFTAAREGIRLSKWSERSSLAFSVTSYICRQHVAATRSQIDNHRIDVVFNSGMELVFSRATLTNSMYLCPIRSFGDFCHRIGE